MSALFFSITISVTFFALLLYSMRNLIAKRYGAKVVYILSLIIAIRLLIPYSIQLPDVPQLGVNIPSMLITVWAAGIAVSIAYQFGKYFCLKKTLIGSSRAVSDETLLSSYEAVRDALFIDKDIPLRVSDRITSPMLIGLFSSCIVLPDRSFTESEAEMILRHELIHYRSRDPFKKLFFSLVSSVQWFNPFVRLIMKEFFNSLECMCDDAVTKNTDTQYKKDYCYMLLKNGEKHGRFETAASYFSTKEMLKMRIESVFGNKNKRSGGLLIIASAMSLTLASSFLCSCAVKTPSNVKEEMSRIEQGIENESSANVESTEAKIDMNLRPVSQVTSSALAAIRELNGKDGIFKFDDCDVIIPQLSEMPEYSVKFEAGRETPQLKYEQYLMIEKDIFGEGVFDPSELKLYPGTWLGTDPIPLDDYLKLKDGIGIIANRNNGNTIELQPACIFYWFAYHDEIYHKKSDSKYLKKYDCSKCTEAELAEEWMLYGGKTTVAEIKKTAEDLLEKLIDKVDDKVSFRLSSICINGDKDDEEHTVRINFRMFCDETPMLQLYKNYDDTDVIKYKGLLMGNSELYMCRPGEISQVHTNGNNTAFEPTGNAVKEILSVEQVFALLKDKLSNAVVYNVKSVELGYSGTAMDDDEYWFRNKTYPIYNVVLETSSNTMHISVDAITGEMNILTSRKRD